MQLVKDQRSFCETRSLAVSININAFNWAMKTAEHFENILENLEFYIVAC